jgi:hypothetical protein
VRSFPSGAHAQEHPGLVDGNDTLPAREIEGIQRLIGDDPGIVDQDVDPAVLGEDRLDGASFNWIFSGGDVVVSEGTSHGEHKDGTWRAGMPDWGAGRWCDVFEIRDWK